MARLWSLEIVTPTEKSWAVVMQAVTAAGLKTADAAAGLGVLMELKRLLKRRDGEQRRPVTVEHYPSHPRDLPSHLYEAAYTSDDPPCSLDEVAVLQQKVWVRKSARAVRNANGPSDMVAVPKLADKTGGGEQMLMQQMLEFGNMIREVWLGSAGSSGSHGNTGQMFQPRAKTQQALPAAPAQCALTNGSGEANNHNNTPASSVNTAPARPAAPPPLPPAPIAQTQAGQHIPQPADTPSPEELHAMMGGKHEQQGNTQAKASPTPALKGVAQEKAKGVAQKHLKVKGKAKCEAKHSGGLKPVTATPAKNKWVVEVRHRETGQTDKHYRSPQGKCYRTLREAKDAGFKE